ncbi:MAG: hypothetical protein HN380_14235 [Victivallales bacterium]|nr:hypothetical protein [Victivallales bacterium]
MHHLTNPFFLAAILALATVSRAADSRTDWSSQQLFEKPSAAWSVGTVPSSDWSGAYHVAEREGDTWFKGKERGNLDRSAWRTEYLKGRRELCLFPGDSYDSVLVWTPSRSGMYNVQVAIWSSEKGNGIEFSVQNTALGSSRLSLLTDVVHNGAKDLRLDHVVMAKGQRLLFRTGKNGSRAYDHANQLRVTIQLSQPMTDEDALRLASQARRNVTLGDGRSRIELTPQGVLVGVYDDITGTSLLRVGKETPAWRIEYADGEKLTNRDYGTPTVGVLADGVAFTWRQAGLPEVVGRASFDPPRGHFRFSVSVKDQTKQVNYVSFPAELNVPATRPNYLITASDDKFCTAIKPLHTLTDFTVMYPGFLFMQMAGFRIADSSLLVYTDDTAGQVKWHRYKKMGDLVQLNLAQYVRLRPGEQWDAPYGVILKVIPNGTHNELSYAYGQWGRQQWWAKSKLSQKVTRCPLLERYFTDGIVRYTVPPYAYGRGCYTGPDAPFYRDKTGAYHYREDNKWSQYEPYYDSIVKAMDKYEQLYDVKPGYWFPVWSGHFYDTAFPDYLPVLACMGDLGAFKQSNIRNRRPMLYHLNIAHWPEINPTPKQHPEYIAINDAGSFYYQTWGELRHVLSSPDVSLPREMRTVRELMDKQSVNGIYLDVIGHAFATDANPRSQFKDCANGYQQAKMLAFKTVRTAGGGPLMTEGRNEIELPYMDMGCGANGTPKSDQVPLWQMVYGDCAANVTYYVGGRSVRNFTWSMGGVQALQWEWPQPDGTRVFNHVTSTQQRVVSQVIGKRMRRYDRLAGPLRASHWDNASVIWNNGSIGKRMTADSQVLSAVGNTQVAAMAPDGLVMLVRDSPDFIADSVREIVLNDTTIFHCSTNSLIIARGQGKWVVSNPGKAPVSAKFILGEQLAPTANLSGRLVRSSKPMQVAVGRSDAGATFSLDLPAGECAVLK